MPRLGSKKSRNGCQQCKARRVKCDENRPCSACTRYKVECSLLNHVGTSSLHEAWSTTSSPRTFREPSVDTPQLHHGGASSTSPESSENTPAQEHSSSVLRTRSTPAPVESNTLPWITDLELMHHYTAYAHATLPGIQHIWGYAVPQEAFKHPFLMHSILAYSAYHLAHLNPSNATHFRLLASTHHNASITTINRKLAALDVHLNLPLPPDVCHALFGAASMIVINAFADARQGTLSALLDIFHLIRGMAFILHTSEPELEKGPFAVLLKPLEHPPKPPPLLCSYLVDLQVLASCSLALDSSSGTIPSGTNATSTTTMFSNAAEKLRQSLQHGIECSAHPAFRACIVWPIEVDPEFIEVMKAMAASLLRHDTGNSTHPEKKEHEHPGESERERDLVREVLWQYCRLLEFSAADWWFMASWRGTTEGIRRVGQER